MATWSENGRALGFAGCLCAFALACTLNPIAGDLSATAAGVPPSMAQGFSEIVKKVTPAVLLADRQARSQEGNCPRLLQCLRVLTDDLIKAPVRA
jgi:hypothetical protein